MNFTHIPLYCSLSQTLIVGFKEHPASVNSEHEVNWRLLVFNIFDLGILILLSSRSKLKIMLCSNPIATKRSINGAQSQHYKSDGGGQNCNKEQEISSIQNYYHHQLRLYRSRGNSLQLDHMYSGKTIHCTCQ